MPNRILRDYTNSDKIELVSSDAECLFVRLMTQADDHGSFYANPKIVKSACFPLKNWSNEKVERLINELVGAKLIIIYQSGDKKYLHIVDFKQRLRNMRGKYPQITEVDLNEAFDMPCPQVAASRRESPPETKRNEVETEVEVETETEVPTAGIYSDFISDFNSLMGKKYTGDKKSKEHFSARIKEGFKRGDFINAIQNAMQDKWQQENSFKYLTPEYITRSDQLQKWMNFTPMQIIQQPKKSKADEAVERIEKMKELFNDNDTLKVG